MIPCVRDDQGSAEQSSPQSKHERFSGRSRTSLKSVMLCFACCCVPGVLAKTVCRTLRHLILPKSAGWLTGPHTVIRTL